MDENLCVCCGAVIPEGRQICPACAEKCLGEAFKKGKMISSCEGTFDEVAAWADRTDADEINIRRKYP